MKVAVKDRRRTTSTIFDFNTHPPSPLDRELLLRCFPMIPDTLSRLSSLLASCSIAVFILLLALRSAFLVAPRALAADDEMERR